MVNFSRIRLQEFLGEQLSLEFLGLSLSLSFSSLSLHCASLSSGPLVVVMQLPKDKFGHIFDLAINRVKLAIFQDFNWWLSWKQLILGFFFISLSYCNCLNTKLVYLSSTSIKLLELLRTMLCEPFKFLLYLLLRFLIAKDGQNKS